MNKQRESAVPAVTTTIITAILCFCLLAANRVEGQTQQTTSALATKSSGKISTQESPFYCSIEKTLTKAEREHKKQLSIKMAGARLETRELADGYAFRFRPGDLTLAELADWVTTESRCCPFFDLEIGVEREGGPLWLRVGGREGVKQFIRGEFKLLNLP